jgi:hypothetical protein
VNRRAAPAQGYFYKHLFLNIIFNFSACAARAAAIPVILRTLFDASPFSIPHFHF